MKKVVTFDATQRRRHKWRNRLHTLALLLLMFGMLAVCAWLFAGWDGVFWSLAIGALLLVFVDKSSPQIVLSLYSAREVPLEMFPDAYAVLRTLTERAGLPVLPRLHYVPSSMPTAFSMGSPADPHVAVSDGMLRLLGPRELSAVLAHEVSHIRNNDLAVMAIADIAGRLTYFVGFAGMMLLALSLPAWLAAYGFIPWLPGLIMFLAPTLSNLLQLGLSRAREFDADLDAATLTKDPAALASALGKMERQSRGFFQRLILGNRESAIPSILRTHPPTHERIERLLSLYRVERFEPVRAQKFLIPATFVRPRAVPRRRFSGLRW